MEALEDNRKNDLILIMTPEKQDKTLELSKHWFVDSTPERNEVITKASESTNARFKRKKIRSIKREADRIAEKLGESEKALKLLEPRVPKDPTLK